MFNLLAQLYWCMLVAPEYREQVTDLLIGAGTLGLAEGRPYRLWTLETGALGLALPLAVPTPMHGPEERASGCFHPVSPAALEPSVLMAAQGHEATVRQLARRRGIMLPEAILLYVSEQPGEMILSLKCEDDGPAWDQRVWLVRVVEDEGWAWQVHHLHHNPSGEPATCPKFAWKDVAPPVPALLQTKSRAKAGHIIAVRLEDGR